MTTLAVDSDAYRERVHGVLARAYGRLKHGPKLLARDAAVAVRTAENWLQAINAPRGPELIRAMAACDELAAEINAMVAELRSREVRCADRS